MKKLSQIIRLFYIYYVMTRRGVDRLFFSLSPFKPSLLFRLFTLLNPLYWYRGHTSDVGTSIRLALEELGPIFVKFGQILSTRPDLLSDEIVSALEKLQDQVPPFPGKEAQGIVETALGKPITALFAEFSLTPMGSASIAQVHSAFLPDGRPVVVKIRRPQIEKSIRRDIDLLYCVARWAERFWSHGRRLRLQDLVKEFENTLTDELDFLREAANASQLRRNFQGSHLLHVPEVYWEYTTSNVFVMERIFGVRISDKEALNAAQVNLKTLAEYGVEIFFTQVFRDSFFHADMHPGNVFVSTEDPDNPCYKAVDFGIMGSLTPVDQRYLAENLLAFFKRDYRQVALLHVASGWVPPDTRVNEFEAAIRGVCEPIFERPLRDISFGQLLLRLFQTAGRFNMEIQPQLFLLQKTLWNIEGLGRQLYPDLNLWDTAKPFLERWIKQQYSPRRYLKQWLHQLPRTVENQLLVPGLWHDVLRDQKNRQVMSTLHPPSVSPKKYTLKALFVAFLMGMACLWMYTHWN